MIFDLIVDVILLSVFSVIAYLGYKKGIFKITLKPFCILISFAASLSLCDGVAERIVSPIIAPLVRRVFADDLLQGSIGQIIDPEVALSLVSRMLDYVISFVSQALAFALSYLVIRFVLKLFVGSVGQFLEIGMPGRINSFLGICLSCCIGFSVIRLIATAIDYALLLDAFADSTFAKEFEGGVIYDYLTDLSPDSVDFQP